MRTQASLGLSWIADLAHSLAYGDTIADAASMLCREEPEVRQKAKAGLVEQPGKRTNRESTARKLVSCNSSTAIPAPASKGSAAAPMNGSYERYR